MTGLEGFRAMSEGELDIRAWWLFLGMVLEASIYPLSSAPPGRSVMVGMHWPHSLPKSLEVS